MPNLLGPVGGAVLLTAPGGRYSLYTSSDHATTQINDSVENQLVLRNQKQLAVERALDKLR